jgi:Flp pilus assembly pilin Flp
MIYVKDRRRRRKTKMLQIVKTRLARLGSDQRGQDFVEYALITGFAATSATAVSSAVAATATQLGGTIGAILRVLSAAAN